MAVSKGEGRSEENEGRERKVTHPFEDTQSKWEAVLRGCYETQRVMVPSREKSKSITEETAGTGWKNKDLNKFLLR